MPILNPPLLSIVGTTSVGKSDAALDMANYLIENKYCSGVSIISADSRQIYQGLEILAGADIPAGFERTHDASITEQYFFQKDALKIFGLSSIKVTEDWSVSQFREFSQKICSEAFSRGELVIVVGGTGLYHDYILNTDPLLDVPPNQVVREKATTLDVTQLQAWLEQINPIKLAEMNNSDKHNPRRLIRAIEIGLAGKSIISDTDDSDLLKNTQHYFIGLQIPQEQLERNITLRVEKRFLQAVAEVKKILDSKHAISSQVSTTLGFPELQSYIEGTQTEEECKKLWIQSEIQYSKRQLTWWKKQDSIHWFEKQNPDWFKNLTTSVQKLLTDN